MKNISSLTDEEVEAEINQLEDKGYIFFVDCHADDETPFYTPDRIKFPDGRILDQQEITQSLKENHSDNSLILADRLMDLCFSEQYGDSRFIHYSFDGDEDIKNCREKYGN